MGKSKIATIVHKVKLLEYTEMTIYSDIVIKQEAKTRLRQVGVKKTDPVYDKKPINCNQCKSTEIVGLEILGASDEVLFWICDTCEHLHLKYPTKVTEECLEKGSAYWSNPNDWLDSTETIN